MQSLDQSLQGRLNIFSGNPLQILSRLVEENQAAGVYWNRCYDAQSIERDGLIKSTFRDAGLQVKSFNGSLLWEPWQVLKNDGTHYKVFTPYYRRGCLQQSAPRRPLPAPENMQLLKLDNSLTVEALSLLSAINWHKKMEGHWDISEEGARDRLDKFIFNGIQDYRDGRNFPDRENVSRLSPYLHFGQISVNTAWHTALDAAPVIGNEKSLDTFLSELGWREFSYYLLYHYPQLPTENLQPRFDRFPWEKDGESALRAWQTGQTGYPLVDAGMRELWQTGYMHNRVRMVVGSFLVKNLLIHWHSGEQWFWDCLVDADLASNSASWQWVAGCGADAAPFFRIFNPITQSEKFDKQGDYIRRYVPELSDMPAKYIHAPWLAPAEVLDTAGVEIGGNYPAPIVDVKASRERALDAFKLTKDDVA